MMPLLRFTLGLASGVLLGGLGAWLADFFKDVDSSEAFAARARELEREPERIVALLNARVSAAVDEGRRAAAARQAELRAARPTAPAARPRGAGARKAQRAGDRPADRVGHSDDVPV